MEDTSEKKKPVPRTRNSLRNRGGGSGRSMEDVTVSQSPTLAEQDEHLLGSLGGGSGGSRGESISPDLRNNTPSPRPKPRAKRGFADKDGDITSSSTAPPPLPPTKPYSSSSPSRRGAPPGPPPKIPKTIVTDSSRTSSAGGKKKPLPVLPPRESTPEKRGVGSSKWSSTGSQDRTEVPTTTGSMALTDEDPYSSVDRTQFTDTGPSIQVLDVSSGRSLPLEFVEKELESVGEADTSKSSSILDTVSYIHAHATCTYM